MNFKCADNIKITPSIIVDLSKYNNYLINLTNEYHIRSDELNDQFNNVKESGILKKLHDVGINVDHINQDVIDIVFERIHNMINNNKYPHYNPFASNSTEENKQYEEK
jgi:hypothetical protein